MSRIEDYQAVDLFCGVGGLSYGMKQIGIDIVAGVDIDSTCEYAFTTNINARFLNKSIHELKGHELSDIYSKDKKRILVGCAPCQPFSSHTHKLKNKKNISLEDDRWSLLNEFSRLIYETQPEIISMENVPKILNHSIFDNFLQALRENNYHVSSYKKIVYCPDYGVPQSRHRLVLLASKLGQIELIPPTHFEHLTVRGTIKNLDPIKDGEAHKNDVLHRARKLSALNKLRIKNIKEGESWTSFTDDALIAPCHKSKNGKKFTSVYGRMNWDHVAPTITTHCIGFSNGRFGHPEQDRAISLREASLLQSFPSTYQFISDPDTVCMGNIARHIGNAVPPKLGEAIAKSIKIHIENISK
jgi:DNA (cytosine-5)-methyltransferase 1